jgi:hypothetical protein
MNWQRFWLSPIVCRSQSDPDYPRDFVPKIRFWWLKINRLLFFLTTGWVWPVLEANQLFKQNCYLKSGAERIATACRKSSLFTNANTPQFWAKRTLLAKKIDYYLEHRVIPTAAKSEFEGHLLDCLERNSFYASISKLNSQLKATSEKLGFVVYVAVDKSKIELDNETREQNLLKTKRKLINTKLDGR